MGSGTFKKRFASATDAFDKQESTELNMLEDAQKSRDDITCLVREARKQVSAQAKVCHLSYIPFVLYQFILFFTFSEPKTNQ